jgi:hypothetical protein
MYIGIVNYTRTNRPLWSAGRDGEREASQAEATTWQESSDQGVLYWTRSYGQELATRTKICSRGSNTETRTTEFFGGDM